MKTPPPPTPADQQLIEALRHAEAMEAERDALATQNVLFREAIARISAEISGCRFELGWQVIQHFAQLIAKATAEAELHAGAEHFRNMRERCASLQRRADRDRWCEEYQADVVHLLDGRWCVTFLDGFLNQRTYYASTRDAAIDKAIKETE